MRVVLVLGLFGCTSGQDLVISPASGPPIGVGLTASFTTEAWIGDLSPHSITPAVDVEDGGDVVSAGAVMYGFALKALAEGSATVEVSDPNSDASTELAVDTGVVTSTRLFVEHPYPSLQLPDVEFPLSAFTGAHVAVAQQSSGRTGPLAGIASLTLDANATGVTPDAARQDMFATGSVLGTATLTTPVTTTTLAVVDGDAIADFALARSFAAAIEVHVSLGTDLRYLEAVDAAGLEIIGAGPEPTFVIADPAVLAIESRITNDEARELTFVPVGYGSTTVDVGWGAAHKLLAVTISH